MIKLIYLLVVLAIVTFWAIGLKEYFDAKKAKNAKLDSAKKTKKK